MYYRLSSCCSIYCLLSTAEQTQWYLHTEEHMGGHLGRVMTCGLGGSSAYFLSLPKEMENTHTEKWLSAGSERMKNVFVSGHVFLLSLSPSFILTVNKTHTHTHSYVTLDTHAACWVSVFTALLHSVAHSQVHGCTRARSIPRQPLYCDQLYML